MRDLSPVPIIHLLGVYYMFVWWMQLPLAACFLSVRYFKCNAFLREPQAL